MKNIVKPYLNSGVPRFQMQATIESPPQQFCPKTAEEPDENSHAKASSSPASQPVVCSQYRLSKFQEEEDGRDEVNHSTGEPEVPAVNEDASATPITGCLRSGFFLRSLETLNQALNLPQNPTSPICARLCLKEM